jgi:cysteine-rich repeat protein
MHAGCLQTASQTCASGAVCPPGTQCVDTGGDSTGRQLCAVSSCGNGHPDPDEACDDGNNRSGDGCPADCTPACGDGVPDPGEVCDDGNTSDGDGCSGDCRLLEGGFEVSPASVALQAIEGDPLPSAITLTVRFAYVGDTVLAGFAPGVPQPSWLAISERSSTSTTAVLELRMTDTAMVGERTTRLRLTIRHRSSTGLETFDLPIVYRVVASDLAAQGAPASLAFTAASDDMGMPSRAVHVTFNGDAVALVSAPPWLTVTGPRAPTSPAPFTASINSTAFAAGTTLSGDVVFATMRGRLQRTTSIHVDYHVVAPSDLALSATPATLTLTAVTGSATPPPQTVDVTFTGASVELVSAPMWLTVTAPAFPTSPASFAVSVDTTALPPETVLLGEIWFSTTRHGSTEFTQVPVEFNVLHAPEIQFVAPYVGIAGRGGTLYVRGHGLATGTPVTARIGELTLAPVEPDGNSAVKLSYPALPEGRYPVAVLDPPGIPSRSPELVIVAPPRFAYQAIPTGGPHTRILYDPEREALYAVNQRDQQIERFVYESGTWSARPPHVIPLLTDIAMTPDGRSLIVLDRAMINEMSLTDGLFVAMERVPFPVFYGGCDFFSEAATASNGKIFVNTRSQWAGSYGSCMAYFYDILDPSLREIENFAGGHCGASGDGSRIYAGGESGNAYRIYDSLSGTMSSPTSSAGGLAWASASTDGARVLLGGTSVWDRSLNYLGRFPYRGVDVALMSRSGSRAYVYLQDDAGGHIEVYDLDSPIESDEMYPLLNTVTVPHRANSRAYDTIRMTSSLDDSTVFVLGDTHLLVVPVE